MFYRSNGRAKPLRRRLATPSIRYHGQWKKETSDAALWALALVYANKTGPYCDRLSKLIAKKDYAGIIALDLSPSTHSELFGDSGSSIRWYSAVRQVLALFQKNEDFDLGVSREAVAYETFCQAELRCRSTNAKIITDRFLLNQDFSRIIRCAESKIAEILGDCPTLGELTLAFGPGASTTVKKKTSARYKLDAVPCCSREASLRIFDLWEACPHYAFGHNWLHSVDTGKLTFVPKTAKTDRSITIEPSLNTLVQKGIGTNIRKKLRTVGIDLKDQRRNRKLAREGSIDGSYATIDLKSASDTNAKLLVHLLLPKDWVRLLDSWRTGSITYEKRNLTFELQKFSSMGNGYTFELESLIFYALTWATLVCKNHPRVVSVYGDDIIVANTAYADVTETLERSGFWINHQKSFHEGPFRESCGGDYFLGVPVRPFYVKGRLTYGRLVALLNQDYRGSAFLTAEERASLIVLIPEFYRKIGPDGYGDGHIVVAHPILTPFKRDKGWGGYTFETLIVKPSKSCEPLTVGDSLYPTYQLSVGNKPAYVGIKRNFPAWKVTDRWVIPNGTLAVDPYTYRGGTKEKYTRVYTFDSQPCDLQEVAPAS